MDMGNLSRHVLSENFTCIPCHSMEGIFIMYLHLLDFHGINLSTIPVPWMVSVSDPPFSSTTAGSQSSHWLKNKGNGVPHLDEFPKLVVLRRCAVLIKG